ncbi:MAG: DUF362 domain-containing protein [Candidatus Eremiobacteraeota bacterium]|nr:DUF362 domain-containing protein [Candidatus Eremiobacteraeota bacterium]
MDSRITRKELLKKAGQLGLAIAGIELLSNVDLFRTVSRASAAQKSTIVVASKGSTTRMVAQALAKAGGIGKYVKKGSKVVIKPNAAWAMRPEQAANTNPEVIDILIKLCKKAGASSVVAYEHTCDSYPVAFRENGIKAACNKNGIKLISASEKHYYRNIKIPGGKTLKGVNAIKAILDADCYINVPIVKVHSAGIVTICLKNQMGCVFDRAEFHRKGLHKCIADAARVIRPHLCVVDATRILLTRGPRGPGKVKNEHKILVGTDMVALDAYGSNLLGVNPEKVPHIVLANKYGIGRMDLKKVNIINI